MSQLARGAMVVAVLSLAAAIPGEAGFAPAVSYPTGANPKSVAIADLNGDGALDVAVVHTATDNVSVLLGNGDGTLDPPASTGTENAPLALAVGDFNGDGRPDLVIACASPGKLAIHLGNGDGTFQAPLSQPTVGLALLAVGDFDRDGRLDVAASSSILTTVAIFRGNGDGTLQAAVTYAVPGLVDGVAVADFNRDGTLDLAVANRANRLSILVGNGDGTFQAALNSDAGIQATWIAVGDFNEDGQPDLALGSLAGIPGNDLSILLGTGNGLFAAPATFDAGDGGWSVRVGDLDGDGRQDVVVGNSSDVVTVLRGKGDGTFQAKVSYASAGSAPNSLAFGDFDRDGQIDLLTANVGGASVSVLLNDAAGAVCADESVVTYPTGSNPSSVAVGDLNRDGKQDLAVTNRGGSAPNSVSVLLGNGDGTFQGKADFLVGSDPRSVAVGDFDRDGRPDLAVGNTFSNNVSILLGNGAGSFATAVNYPASAPTVIALGDFNGDGKADIAAADGALGGGVRILLGNGDGTFTTGAFPAIPPLGTGIAVADLNGDGKLDLAVTTQGFTPDPGRVSVLVGNGDGTFQPRIDYLPGGIATRSVAVGDFNRDGHTDLAVTFFATVDLTAPSVAVLLNNGDGTFPTVVPYVTGGSNAFAIVAADLNRDGRLDLAVGHTQTGEIAVLAGIGDGTFDDNPGALYPANNPLTVAIGDFNGDGTPDLVGPSILSNVVSVLRGTCQFPTTTALTSSVNPSLLGQPVMFTATVTSAYGTPAGNVTFKDGLTTLGAVPLANNGVATLTTAALVGGSHAITAGYAGTSYFPSASGTLTQVVNTTTVYLAGDVRVTEGNSGTTQAFFIVRLSAAASSTVTVSYQTMAGTASAGSDYLSASGTVTFLPGETVHDVSVTVLGDVAVEPNEAFFLQLSNPVNANLVGRPTEATIVDDDTAGGVARFQPIWHPFFAVDTLETPFVGDFDGDGKTDIITFTRQNPLAFGDVYVALSTGTQFGPGVKWNDFFAINTNEQVVIGDFDGDGKDDIATWLADTSRQIYVALSFGTGMTASTVWETSIGFTPSDVLAAGDVNGDGKADLVLFARMQGKVYTALSTGTSFGPPTVWHNFFAVSTYERPAVADLNGDGKTDIVTFATDSPTAFGDVYTALSDGTKFGDGQNSGKWQDFFAIRQTEIVRIGDLDGDGQDDFFTFLPPPFAQCYTSLSTGTSMGPSVLWPEPVSPDARDKTFVGDANGDGHADIITFAQGEGRVYVSLAP